jgi:hypothetical protein
MLHPRSWTLAAFAAALLSACIPPELTGGQGDPGAGGGASGAGGSAGAGASGGGTTTPEPLCEDGVCEMFGGKCQTGVCVFQCVDDSSCEEVITCPPDMPCRVECTGALTCKSGVDCSPATSCDVVCEGPSSCGLAGVPAIIACPSGSCDLDCEADACVSVTLQCGGAGCKATCLEGACAQLVCEGDCKIQCAGELACGDVKCLGGPCEIGCGSKSACAGVQCGGAECAVTCDGTASCGNVSCVDACACSVECSGRMSCGSGAVCPQDDMMGAGPCSTSLGCASSGQCNTCP